MQMADQVQETTANR